jgi:outer membrane protein TolC
MKQSFNKRTALKRRMIWVVTCCWVFQGALAQTAIDTVASKTWSFTLQEAQTFALKHNRDMIKSGLAVRQSEAAKWAAIANYLPQVNASANYINYLGAQLEIKVFPQPIKMEPSSTLTFQATQLIFNANAVIGMQLANLGKQLAEVSVEQTEKTVRQNVNTAYYSILAAEDNKHLLEQNVANVRNLVKATHAKVAVGMGEQTEADQMDVMLANLENTLQATERTIEVAYNSFRLLLGLAAQDKVVLIDSLQAFSGKEEALALLVEPFDPGQNTELKLSKLSVVMKQKEVNSAKATFLPTIAAAYQYNEKLLKSSFDMTLKQNIVLSASMPLFSSFKNSANVKKAKYAYLSAEQDYEKTLDLMMVQDKQLRFNLKNALDAYEIQQKNITVSKRVFDNITKKYEQGLSSSLEVTNASNNLLTAQGNYINSLMNLLSAKDALKKLLGTL